MCASLAVTRLLRKAPPSRQEREKGRAPAFGWGEGMGQPPIPFVSASTTTLSSRAERERPKEGHAESRDLASAGTRGTKLAGSSPHEVCGAECAVRTPLDSK